MANYKTIGEFLAQAEKDGLELENKKVYDWRRLKNIKSKKDGVTVLFDYDKKTVQKLLLGVSERKNPAKTTKVPAKGVNLSYREFVARAKKDGMVVTVPMVRQWKAKEYIGGSKIGELPATYAYNKAVCRKYFERAKAWRARQGKSKARNKELGVTAKGNKNKPKATPKDVVMVAAHQINDYNELAVRHDVALPTVIQILQDPQAQELVLN